MDFATFLGRARSTLSIDQLLRTQLLWMMLLRAVLYTLLLAISFVFQGGQFDIVVVPTNLLILLLLIVYLTTIFSAFFLLVFQGSLNRFGIAQTLLDTGFVSLLVFFSGSSHSIFTSVYFFPIIAGGLILPRRGGLVSAAAATLQYGAILLLETYGFYPEYLQNHVSFLPSSSMTVLNQFAVHGLTFFLAAILSALFGMRLKKTESALSASIQDFDRLAIFYKQIFDNISTGIVTIDGQSIITSANNSIKSITGYDPGQLIGEKLADYFPNLDLSRDNIRLTTDYQKPDSSTVRIGYAHMIIQPADGQQKSTESPNKIITLQDISEIEQLERQVRQSEKLAAIGMMSASIAHDFRNPLTAISGSAQVLASEFSSGETANYANFELVNIILRESNRVIVTIADLLKFSRPEHTDCKWFSFRHCVDEVLQVLRSDPTWPSSAKIIGEFDDTIDIWGDEKQLFTVLSHLIQNGLAFCPTGEEKIIIQAHETKTAAAHDAVRIRVIDNGPGIPEEGREDIFEPFFTTRPDGTGLGLAIVRQTMADHRGTVAVDNSNQGGAMFSLTLPLPH
ncbi:MAG: two-component system sensor histidine kinase NtrB [Desulforhopalus sp.]